jgi:hypothetical protein
MRAVGLYKYLPIGNPESLLDVEVPKPEARGRDLLVQVKAVSVNPKAPPCSPLATRCSTPAATCGPDATASITWSTNGSWAASRATCRTIGKLALTGID